MNLVTIYTYNDLNPATLAKMRLDSEGIEAHIHSSEMLRMTSIISALGGVRLQVQKENSVIAKEIITQFNKEIGIEQ